MIGVKTEYMYVHRYYSIAHSLNKGVSQNIWFLQFSTQVIFTSEKGKSVWKQNRKKKLMCSLLERGSTVKGRRSLINIQSYQLISEITAGNKLATFSPYLADTFSIH